MPETVIKTLPMPWKVGGQDATEVEIREPLLEDLLEAEKEAHPGMNPQGYQVALACRQIVRAGTFTGPFAPGQFKKMKPRVFVAIREAMEEAEKLGEAEQATSTQPD